MLSEKCYQAKLIKELRERFPGCVVIKNDPKYMQGMPDLTVLYGTCWGMLEAKTHRDASRQPNQDYYLELFDSMSFAKLIYPEIHEEVLDELQQRFDELARNTCFP